MGIHCEININGPPNAVYVGGNLVSGQIKYAVDEATSFKKITMSLKCIATLRIKKISSKRRSDDVYFRKKKYVNIEQVVLDKENDNGDLDIGSYCAPFKFQIPERCPPSVDAFRRKPSYTLKYKVAYYIAMKFEKTAFLSFTKRFKKEIQVVTDIQPTFAQEPLIYGERKTLFYPFSATESIVNIKSTILNSVIKAGDTVQFEYEVANNSHVTVNSVETKIVEIIKSRKRRKHLLFYKDLDDTDSKTGSIENGKTQQMIVDIKVPEDALTIDNCELAERKYAVLIIVALPMPHLNFQLTIPIQVMLKANSECVEVEDAPPSYWDVMCEDKKELEE